MLGVVVCSTWMIFDNRFLVRKVTRDLCYGSYGSYANYAKYAAMSALFTCSFFRARVDYLKTTTQEQPLDENAIPSRTAPSLIHSSIHPIVILDFCQHLHIAMYYNREIWTHWLLLVSAKFS